MSYEEMLAQQFVAFHTAVIDSCGRSNQPQQTDAMALRLRNNALAMTKLQMTLLPHVRSADVQTPCNTEPQPKATHAPEPAPMLDRKAGPNRKSRRGQRTLNPSQARLIPTRSTS